MEILNLVLLAVCIGICHATENNFLGDLPLENPDLIEGDILPIDDSNDRNAIVNTGQLWPGGVVPYVHEPGLISYQTIHPALWAVAVSMFEKNTCVRFVPRTNEKDYVRIFLGQGCYSHVGKTGGAQPLSLGKGCNFMGTVTHELTHALGFYHEQNRSDRDDYIDIHWENIKEGMEDQFMKLKPHQNQLLTPFDYDSIMLYGSYTFSKDRKNKLMTMTGKGNKYLQEVVHKYFMSKSDFLRINKLYNCTEHLKKM
ncbi:astacin-like metalloprotease toxin 5 [Stegodyphus dumicola]|uniref:astacin-like metalloprotease toxin 5 n=1 Tax=Stegodyphus dumicola TaxID=202533 RepID=UPI0015AB01DE|nr:astacin-like metalloprotease toxin 5 [Stegodyphus dumicola]